MRALQAASPGHISSLRLTDDRAVPSDPEPAEGQPYVLVKIQAAALNPVDLHMLLTDMSAMIRSWPHAFGCDMAGTVEEEADGSPWSHSARVWAYTDLGKPWSGTLAEYVRVPADLLGAVPDSVTFQEAATLGVGSLTAALGLFHHLGLSMEHSADNASTHILVYGASSSVGHYAVNLAKISGYTVAAVASAKHHDYITNTLKADQVYDYHDPDWVKRVAAVNGGMRYAFDAIGPTATGACLQALNNAGAGADATVATILPNHMLPAELQSAGNAVRNINLGVAYTEAREQLVTYMRKLSDNLAAGRLIPNRVRVLGGLEAAVGGYEELHAGTVSGEKLVVNV